MKWSIVAFAALLLSACGQDAGREPTREADARAASSIESPDAPGGGPSGQTPDAEQPGGAPSQVQSAPDAAGPSIGEGAPQP